VGHGQTWAAHTAEEFRHLAEVLPILYRLYARVANPDINPFFSFAVSRDEEGLHYAVLRSASEPAVPAAVPVARR
jgi:hypothetical protein